MSRFYCTLICLFFFANSANATSLELLAGCNHAESIGRITQMETILQSMKRHQTTIERLMDSNQERCANQALNPALAAAFTGFDTNAVQVGPFLARAESAMNKLKYQGCEAAIKAAKTKAETDKRRNETIKAIAEGMCSGRGR